MIMAAIYLMPTMGQPLAGPVMYFSPDLHSWPKRCVLLSPSSYSKETEAQ